MADSDRLEASELVLEAPHLLSQGENLFGEPLRVETLHLNARKSHQNIPDTCLKRPSKNSVAGRIQIWPCDDW